MAKGRKISGGKYKKQSKKKKYALPGIERKVKLRERKQKTVRGQGGNKKTVLLSDNFANVIDSETKKALKEFSEDVLQFASKDAGEQIGLNIEMSLC